MTFQPCHALEPMRSESFQTYTPHSALPQPEKPRGGGDLFPLSGLRFGPTQRTDPESSFNTEFRTLGGEDQTGFSTGESKPPVKYLNFFAAASERYARRRRRRFQRPVAGTCSLYGRPSGQQLRSCVVFWRGSSWGLRLCQRGVQAKAVQGSSCILRPATEGHVSGRRGVRPRAGSSHQHTNASKRQGILIRPERSSL